MVCLLVLDHNAGSVVYNYTTSMMCTMGTLNLSVQGVLLNHPPATISASCAVQGPKDDLSVLLHCVQAQFYASAVSVEVVGEVSRVCTGEYQTGCGSQPFGHPNCH